MNLIPVLVAAEPGLRLAGPSLRLGLEVTVRRWTPGAQSDGHARNKRRLKNPVRVRGSRLGVPVGLTQTVSKSGDASLRLTGSLTVTRKEIPMAVQCYSGAARPTQGASATGPGLPARRIRIKQRFKLVCVPATAPDPADH